MPPAFQLHIMARTEQRLMDHVDVTIHAIARQGTNAQPSQTAISSRRIKTIG